MKSIKGFTLVEIVIVLIIIGIIAATAFPSYINSIIQAKVQTIENNLRSITVAQEKYYEDNGYYCFPTYGCNDFGSINQKLSLSMASGDVNDNIIYSCASSGTCTAASVPLNETVTVNVNGVLTCTGALNTCP